MYKPVDSKSLDRLREKLDFFLVMDDRWSHASSWTFIPHFIRYKIKGVAATVRLFDLYLTQTGSKLSLERIRVNKELNTVIARPTIYGFWEIVMKHYIQDWTKSYDCNKIMIETGISNTPELFLDLGYSQLKVNAAIADEQQAYKGERKYV